MGFASRGVTSAEIQAAIVDDSTRYHGASIAAILAKEAHGFMDFWSEPVDISVNNTAGNKTLGDVVIPNLSGITPLYALAMFKMDLLHNTSGGGNGFITNTAIQVDESAGGWTNAILILEWLYGLPAGENRANAIDIIGHYDLVGKVASMNSTINFQWTGAKCNGADLKGKDCRSGIRVFY